VTARSGTKILQVRAAGARPALTVVAHNFCFESEADLCYGRFMIRVECVASGPNGSSDPAVIWFGARRVEVRAVTDRWFGRDHRWWKLDTIDGSYIVRLEESTGSWELAAVVRE
jgi:hypothetical protein